MGLTRMAVGDVFKLCRVRHRTTLTEE